MWFSTIVVPGADHAARSASSLSAHERTLPYNFTMLPSTTTLIRRASSSALRRSAFERYPAVLYRHLNPVGGNADVFTVLTKLSLGDAAQYGALVQLSPLAFAGWLGLFITALNLLPVGQLDGGHITRAMFGSRVGQTISSVPMWSLFLLALFVWPGLMMWALIVFLIAGRGTPPLNDLTPLDTGRMEVGYIAMLILILILAPMPNSLWDSASDVCPYL